MFFFLFFFCGVGKAQHTAFLMRYIMREAKRSHTLGQNRLTTSALLGVGGVWLRVDGGAASAPVVPWYCLAIKEGITQT
jgi:hypothetical protein